MSENRELTGVFIRHEGEARDIGDLPWEVVKEWLDTKTPSYAQSVVQILHKVIQDLGNQFDIKSEIKDV